MSRWVVHVVQPHTTATASDHSTSAILIAVIVLLVIVGLGRMILRAIGSAAGALTRLLELTAKVVGSTLLVLLIVSGGAAIALFAALAAAKS